MNKRVRVRRRSVKVDHRDYVLVESLADFGRLELDRHPLVRRLRRPQLCRTHLATDYSDAPGVRRLGYTASGPVVLLTTPLAGQRHYPELLIRCDRGYLSRVEALALEFIPTQDEIAARMAEIRRENDEAGIIRDSQFTGFDIPRILCGRAVAPESPAAW